LRNVRAVAAFNQQGRAKARFGAINADMRQAHSAADIVEARFSPMADVILATGTAAVLIVGAGQVTAGHISLGTMLVLLSYVAMMYAPIRSIVRLGSTFARGGASRRRLAHVLDSTQTLPPPAFPAQLPPPSAAGRELRFDRVDFAYEAGRPVLNGLSLTAPSGSFTCVVGESGTGKTTALTLALRLHDPSAGKVLLDGVDIRRLDPQALREELALVPQDSWLLDGTLLDNVRLGDLHVTENEVWKALAAVELSALVARLPDGLYTAIGEDGIALSGGERRRLAIARALLRPGRVMLLDEPTAGLDAHTEAAIVHTLRHLGTSRTVLAVTHQLALAAVADQVVVMRDGTVAEAGPPADLLERASLFRALWDVRSTSREPALSPA
jgi:ATP-binding cassette subfamily B protein